MKGNNPKSNGQKKTALLQSLEQNARKCCNANVGIVFIGLGHGHPVGYCCPVCGKRYPLKKETLKMLV